MSRLANTIKKINICMTNINFYNLYHHGDLFFTQPIVKNICNNNKQYKFTLYCIYNSFIFSNITNLRVEHTICESILNNKSTQFFFANNNTLFINMWVGCVNKDTCSTKKKLLQIECNLREQVEYFTAVFDYLKTRHSIVINIDPFDSVKYLPILPSVKLTDFHKWNGSRNKIRKKIFYFNYAPKSSQRLSVKSTQHETVLKKLASTFSQHDFIIPNITPNLKGISNIIDCNALFSCKETQSCENICKLHHIASLCDYAIVFDIGACFFYLNTLLLTSACQVLHIALTPRYYECITINFPNIRNKVTFIMAKDDVETCTKLYDVLANKH